MKYLLDTHALLWALEAPDQLSEQAREIIQNPDSEIFVSPVLPWEIAIKANTKKIPMYPLLSSFHRVMRETGFIVIGIDPLHAIRSGLLPFHHRDPFDRLLAAQSLEMNIPILSRDRQLDLYGVSRIW